MTTIWERREYFLGPLGSLDPTNFIIVEANHIPFRTSSPILSDWKYNFTSWLSVFPGWRDRYNRVSTTKSNHWNQHGFVHAFNLSLGNLSVNAHLLLTGCYFWSNTLNTFMFGHGPMSPTLLDVFILTNLDVISSTNPNKLQIILHHKNLVFHQHVMSCWRAFVNDHNKRRGPVGDRKHTTFLMPWLGHFVL
jgi:hypothetical protein